MDRRGRPGDGRTEDLPHDARSHGAPGAKRDLVALHLCVHPGGQRGPGGRTT
jgi:hypothetical protein